MATLHIENVPNDLYEALRTQARQHRRSISAEVLALLADSVPTKAELVQRKNLLACAVRLSAMPSTGDHLSAEDLLRQDRER